jgi:hypothetical protein
VDLVERYAHAIGAYLPRAQRDDIVTELAEDVRSQIDDREAQLGRALTESGFSPPQAMSFQRQW